MVRAGEAPLFQIKTKADVEVAIVNQSPGDLLIALAGVPTRLR